MSDRDAPEPAEALPEDAAEEPLVDLEAEVDEGLRLCRIGKWKEGLFHLGKVAKADDRGFELPGRYFSFLGYGIARYEKRVDEGLTLCEHAIKIEFYEPENFLNLARTQLLKGEKRKALQTLERGLAVDARNPELVALRLEQGVRRGPVVGWLPRDHRLNRFLGRLRHGFLGPLKSLPER